MPIVHFKCTIYTTNVRTYYGRVGKLKEDHMSWMTDIWRLGIT